MTTSKDDAKKAGKLMHDKDKDVRSVAASDLAQSKRHRRKGPRKGGRKSGR